MRINLNEVGRDMGERRRDIYKGKVDIGVIMKRPHVYKWGSVMEFLSDGHQLLIMDSHGLTHMWLVSAPQQMIPPFKNIQF